MKHFIIRLNTLALLLVCVGAVVFASVFTFQSVSTINKCKNQRFDFFYTLSFVPIRKLSPSQPLMWEDLCENGEIENNKNEIFICIGFTAIGLFMAFLTSATVSWLFGGGFKLHFIFKTENQAVQ